MVLNIWKFRVLLKNLKFQNAESYLNFSLKKLKMIFKIIT